jgi:hypothetical protein
VVTAEQVDLDTLAERIGRELRVTDADSTPPTLVGAVDHT